MVIKATLKKKKRRLLFSFLTASFYVTLFYIAYRCAWFQPNRISCNKKRKKQFKSKQYSLGIDDHFCENYENSSYVFSMYRICAKNFYVSCLCFSKLLKIKKMFDRQSLVNVTLKIRTKFHSNRLVRYRDILHTVSKHLVLRKTRLKFQNVVFHMYPSLTFFTYVSRLAVLTIHN